MLKYLMPFSLLSLLVIYAFSDYWPIIEAKVVYFFIDDMDDF